MGSFEAIGAPEQTPNGGQAYRIPLPGLRCGQAFVGHPRAKCEHVGTKRRVGKGGFSHIRIVAHAPPHQRSPARNNAVSFAVSRCEPST